MKNVITKKNQLYPQEAGVKGITHSLIVQNKALFTSKVGGLFSIKMSSINYHSYRIFSMVLFLVLVTFSSCEKDPQLPIVNFSFENYQDAPVGVLFTNESEFSEKYLWDFGDGGSSNEQNPTHTYYIPGTYTVSLRAINNEGSTTKTETIVIRGTIYRIVNESTYALNGVVGFYTDGYDIYDLIGFGSIQPGYISAYSFTKRSEITVGFDAPIGGVYVVAEPYLITQNTENILEVNDYTLVYHLNKKANIAEGKSLTVKELFDQF